VGPEQLNLASLKERVDKEEIKEIIIATNPSVEGDTTTLYIARMFRECDVKVTRPARGLPLGSSLEFVDRGTISRALDGREEVD
jgi:recombination protein RecR